MPVPNASAPIRFADPLPERTDVVVIGGGIAGVSAAWHLARRGVPVVLCEKGRIAGEQSSRNWGWVRQQKRDPAELPIMMESIRIWAGLAQATGENLGFRRCGVLYLASTEAEIGGYQRWLPLAQQYGLDTRLLSSREVDALIDDRPGQWRGGLYTASDGQAEPFRAAPGIARGARREGAKIVENCAVRTVDVEAGRVAGVVTERGRIRADAVLCAGGAWSSVLLCHLGIDLPQLSVKSCVARTGLAREVFAGNAAWPDFAFRRRDDGGYTVALGNYHEHYLSSASVRHWAKFIPSLRASWRKTRIRFSGDPMAVASTTWSADEVSPFERCRVLDPAPTPHVVARIRARLGQRLPSLAGVPLVESWAGMIDTMPDVVPVLDAAPRLDGLYVATGFSGHGFGIGPGAGRVMADLIMGRPAGHDLHRFRFARFSDGSPVELGPLL